MVAALVTPACPICGGTRFKQYRGRPRERCTGCKAKKRTRAHYLMLQRLGVAVADRPFYHLSPERPISEKLIALYWDQYRPVDIDPDKFVSPVPVGRLDLGQDLAAMPDDSVSGFFHSHVIEHVRAPLGEVLAQMNRVIAPGGLHVLCVPYSKGDSDEDWSESLSDADRKARFGQENHVRRIGRNDFEDRYLKPAFAGFEEIKVRHLMSLHDAVVNALVPPGARRMGSFSTYIFRKAGGGDAAIGAEPETAAGD